MLSRLFGGIRVSEKPVQEQEQAPAAKEPQRSGTGRGLDVSFTADYPFPCLWDAKDSDGEDEDDVITGSFDEDEDQVQPLDPGKLRLSSVGPMHAVGPDGQELVSANTRTPGAVNVLIRLQSDQPTACSKCDLPPGADLPASTRQQTDAVQCSSSTTTTYLLMLFNTS
jgi:hypothetical protein